MGKNAIIICLSFVILILMFSGCESENTYDNGYDAGFQAAKYEYYDSRYEEGYKEGYNEAKSLVQGFFFSRMDVDGTLDAFWDKWEDEINEFGLEY